MRTVLQTFRNHWDSRWQHWWALGLIVAGPPEAAADQPAILGVWETQKDRSRIEFYPCGEAICGQMVWLEDADARDDNNPDPDLRGRRLEGLTVFRGFERSGAQSWSGGTVYDAEDGTTHGDGAVEITLRLTGPDQLEVEGCFAIFCQDNVMTRYDESE